MLEIITTRAGDFTAAVAGPREGALALLLHGFPQSRHAWRHQVPALAAAGYRAVAPDQRGYSPGARPDPTVDLMAYGMDRLVEDVLDLASALGCDEPKRFHLVGHDWGGQVAWVVADRHPARLASLMVLSRPHPAAFRRALAEDADDQRHRSRHHKRFHDPATAGLLLEDGARRMRRNFAAAGVPPAAVDQYLSVVAAEPAALEAALAWYRAAGSLDAVEVGPIRVPTVYLWSDADASVGAAAARWTGEYVSADYRFEVLPGVGHFSTDEVPQAVTEHLLAQLARTAPR